MFNEKKKAITFSFDDGVIQDIRLIEILNRYKLKCTFNLNSGTLGNKGTIKRNNVVVPFNKVDIDKIDEIYSGHEIAVHTVNHPDLTQLSEDEILYEIEQDKEKLSEWWGQKIVGMAYPMGTADSRVADIIRSNTGIHYARTIKSTYNFEKQSDLLLFNPTVQIIEVEQLFDLAEQFLKDASQNELLFYIWGHSFELDAYDLWDTFEHFCQLISGHNDIFYGTNKEVLLK